MIKKIKEYFEYKRKQRECKMAIIDFASTALPTVNTITTKGSDIVNFVVSLVEEAKNTDSGELINMVLTKVAETLNTDNNRLIEILSYMTTLELTDIQKILVHSMIETSPKIDKNEE